ncbi:riddle [Holotrichia oblita]|uniref:Riddle n=1 Tax=Holotrichia oblita TaxID=644536 RepID=A0ACB9T9M8_HOLOL|nr:riddle [Holotrichia oblita]
MFILRRYSVTRKRARKWVEACGRNDLLTKSTADLQKNYRVCGIHFEKKMFLNDLQNRLQPHAIPTIFPTLEDSSDKIIDRSTSVSEDMKVLVLEIAETHPPQNVQPVQINNIRMLEIAHERKNTSVDTVQHIITEPSASGGCGPNQIMSNTKRCDPVCYSDKPICAPKGSCFCKRGYKRLTDDFTAPCVLPKNCIKCGANQKYKMCGSACPEYCGKPAGTVCTLPCVQGCFCKDGYVLRTEHGGCKPNETTISRNRCDPVCHSDKLLCAPKDSKQQCFCKLGYKRLAHDFAAPCVLPKDCIKCGKNQEYKMCGSACPEYCGKPAGTVCKLPCVRGCFCKEGYVLKAERSNECILKKDCPPKY